MFSTLIPFLLDLVPIPPIAYATYWAFNIRRALAVRLYRNQALGVILVGASFIWSFAVTAYRDLPNGNSSFGVALGVYSFIVPPILTFFWIDASIRTARRSDPLLREVLHWRQVRIGLWALIIVAFSTLVITFVGAFLVGASTNNGPPPLPIFIFFLSPIFVAAISGLVFLPRAAKRSGDRRLGKHLQWFGLFVFFVLFHFVLIFFTGGLLNGILTSISEVIGGYCLYRSVRWLVPLNRITLTGNGSSSSE